MSVTEKDILEAGYIDGPIYGISLKRWAQAINYMNESNKAYLVVDFANKRFSSSDDAGAGITISVENLNWMFLRK